MEQYKKYERPTGEKLVELFEKWIDYDSFRPTILSAYRYWIGSDKDLEIDQKSKLLAKINLATAS